LARSPLPGPWQLKEEGEPVGPDDIASDDPAAVFKMFHIIYRIAGQMGISPREVDELELWQIGLLMTETEQEKTTQSKARGRSSSSKSGKGRPKNVSGGNRKRNLVAERLAHERGEGPKPEPDPVDVKQFSQVFAGGMRHAR